MKLYLVRHSQAFEETQDTACSLTEQGILDAEKIARFLKNANVKIDVILCSRKMRAIQTADILNSILRPDGKVKQINGIAPNDSAEEFINNIELKDKEIMIVGHLPFLSYLISLLLSKEVNLVKIKQVNCSVVCLEQKESMTWQLSFAISPELL